jgi:hypothetical protein
MNIIICPDEGLFKNESKLYGILQKDSKKSA